MFSSHVTADDNVAAKDGLHAKALVNEVRNDSGGHRELNRRGVDDTDDIAGAGRRQVTEEWPVHAVLGVQLNNLLVVVGALKKLDPRVERAAVSPEENLDTINRGVEWVGTKGTTLDRGGGSDAVLRRLVNCVSDDLASERELDLTNVPNGDSVGATRRLDDGTKWPNLAILDVHTHLNRSVVGSVPELDVSVERSTLGAEDDLNLLDGG